MHNNRINNDPLALRIRESLTSFVACGSADQMASYTKSDAHDGMLKAYGHDFLVGIMKTELIAVREGIQLRQEFLQKLISIGVDPVPAFLEVAYRGHLTEGNRTAASRPSMILREILSRPKMFYGTTIYQGSLDSFLLAVPKAAIAKLKCHPEAFGRIYDMTGDRDLLKFVDNKRKGHALSEDLGM